MLKNIAGQALAFFLLFQLISWIREIPLLDTDSQVPAFQLSTINGDSINVDALEGKPTILFFWAPWCSVCKVSMPNLQSFYEDNHEKVNVVSIALSYESKGEVEQIIADKALTFTTALGNDTTAKDFKIQGFPTYYVLDGEGKVHSKSMGYSSELGMAVRTLTL